MTDEEYAISFIFKGGFCEAVIRLVPTESASARLGHRRPRCLDEDYWLADRVISDGKRPSEAPR